MRVLLASGIFPPESGGPATFVPALADELWKRGHEIVVVTNGTVEPDFDSQFPYQVVRIDQTGTLSKYARQLRVLRSVIKQHDPDLAFSNAFDWQSVIAAASTSTPVVTKVVGDMAWERARVRYGISERIEEFRHTTYGPKIELLKRVRTAQTKYSDRVIVPSEYLRQLVTSWGIDPNRVSMIYNSIDLDPAELDRCSRRRRVTTVCRLVDWKGVSGLIDAMGELKQTHDDVTLEIIGDGPHRAELESYAARQLAPDRYQFHGRLSNDEVLSHISESQIFALNSTYEGLPHVVLEAMACGTPAVVSDAGGSPEVISDDISGFVVPQDDGQAFADRFDKLLSDRTLRDQMRIAARERLEDVFDSETMFDNYEKVFEEAVRMQ